jgi:hypothetical protein
MHMHADRNSRVRLRRGKERHLKRLYHIFKMLRTEMQMITYN